ncbi:MAG: hypothetical protein ACP5J0_06375, partial [Pyrobaculum sp.]
RAVRRLYVVVAQMWAARPILASRSPAAPCGLMTGVAVKMTTVPHPASVSMGDATTKGTKRCRGQDYPSTSLHQS